MNFIPNLLRLLPRRCRQSLPPTNTRLSGLAQKPVGWLYILAHRSLLQGSILSPGVLDLANQSVVIYDTGPWHELGLLGIISSFHCARIIPMSALWTNNVERVAILTLRLSKPWFRRVSTNGDRSHLHFSAFPRDLWTRHATDIHNSASL